MILLLNALQVITVPQIYSYTKLKMPKIIFKPSIVYRKISKNMINTHISIHTEAIMVKLAIDHCIIMF